MRNFRGQPETELATTGCLERLVTAGTPQIVADQMLELRREVGEFGTLPYTGHDRADPAIAEPIRVNMLTRLSRKPTAQSLILTDQRKAVPSLY